MLGAVRNFAREEFWGQHRYAFVLHTDEPHPHVHLLSSRGCELEQGVRLNIKKATLRRWRSEFARNLRLLGVEANATERAVRGHGMKAKKDGIYRASLRGDSTQVRAQAEAVAAELLKANNQVETGARTLVDTRRTIESGWRTLADNLAKRRATRTSPARFSYLSIECHHHWTDKEVIAARLLERTRALAREHEASSR